MKRTMKKVLSLVLAASAMAGTMVGCTTKTPEVEMVISYDNKEYTLTYKLYKSVAPSTVDHFMMLVENDYYDGLCVHNYDVTGNKMYTGGYSYVEGGSDGGLEYKSYYDIVKTYKDFKYSVWADLEKKEGLYTLRGEFAANGFKVGDENNSGALKQSLGSLSMFYTEKECEDEVAVYNGTTKKMQKNEYKYNSATSLFAIALTDGSSVSDAYCTFATLTDKSVSVFERLKENIEKDEDFTTQYDFEIDRDDAFVKDYHNSVAYEVPNSPIVIESMKVTKY